MYVGPMATGTDTRTPCAAVRRDRDNIVITRTRTADSAYIVIYGGSMSSGSLLETYAPTLADAVAYHDELLADYYVAAEPWQLDARVESLAVLDAMESGDDEDIIPAYPTCKRCNGLDADQYSVGDDWRGWYCSRCADYMVAAVWYGPVKPSKARAGIRKVAADNGWQRDPLHADIYTAAGLRNADIYTRDGVSVTVDYRANGRIDVGWLTDTAHPSGTAVTVASARNHGAVTGWLKAADADADADMCECDGGAPCADCADAIADADAADAADITELPPVDYADILGTLARKLNRGAMVQWINADLINRADCDVRKSVVLYDADKSFVMALGTAVTPAIFRERMPLVAASMRRAGIRYYSVGIA